MIRKSILLNVLFIFIFIFGLAAPAVPARVAAAPSAASGTADAGFLMVADFEAGLPTGFVAYCDAWDGSGSSSTMAIEAAAIDLFVLPVEATNQAAKITYNIAASGGWGGGPGYGGVTQDFPATQDWSEYTEFSLLYLGSNSGKTVQIELKSDGPAPGTSNRFVYSLTDDLVGWKLVVVPFAAFANRTDYNPGPNPSAPINLMKMWGYSLMLPSGESGVVYLDRVAVTGHIAVADFDAGVPAGFVPFADSWDGSGSATTLSMSNDPTWLPFVPFNTDNKVINVVYNIAASGGWGGGPGYGGVTQDYAAVQDWHGYDSFSLWFQGSNSGAELRIELKSNGANAGASNRYVWSFTDNFAGWKFINVPWSAFVDRTDYNPGPFPYLPLDLTKMWGYSILLPGGAVGSFLLDQVNVYGKPPASQVKVEFASANFNVNEGELATITVQLNQAAGDTVTVDYATSDGSALAGQDYTAVSGTLTFLAGDLEETFTVQTTQDTDTEINEVVNLALSNPTGGAILGARNTATLTIIDDDALAPTVGDPFVKVVDDFEYAAGLPTGTDSFGNSIGFVTWGGPSGDAYPTLALAPVTDPLDPLAVPGVSLPNQILQVDFNIPSGGWGGFTHIFEQSGAWVSQDWHAYTGVSFWIYGTNSGGDVNIDIFDNKTTTGDSCERFTFIFKDDFSGWKYFKVPWEYFSRKGWQPGGAPNDGLTLTEVWGYAFGFPANTGAKTIYIDNVSLMIRHTAVDAYDSLPAGTDSYGNPVGFVTWGGPSGADYPVLSLQPVTDLLDPLLIPYLGVPNSLLKVVYNITGWGGFTHAFEDGTTWVNKNWSTYEGVSFWMYGSNTGGDANLDLMDNKTTTGDSAERFTYIFKDDFSGWKFFMVPFSAFTRKSWQPGGAPDDGFTKTEVWGYAFGFPVGVGAQTAYIDQFEVYGNTQAPAIELKINFVEYAYQAAEGQVATVGVKLSRAATDVVTVDYATADGTATAGRDYTAASGTLTFAVGETTQTFTVTTLQDTVYEGNETVNLALSNPLNAPLGDNKKVTLTILDDDLYDPRLVDNFEVPTSAYCYLPSDDQITRTRQDISLGHPLVIPGQDPINSILEVNVNPNPPGNTQPRQLVRTYAQSVDWSNSYGLRFWYYGYNTKQDLKVLLKENRAPDPGPAGWVLAWADEFNDPAGTQPDPNKWGYDLGGGGWGNNELEYYTNNAENAATDGSGNLAIVARKIDDPAGSGLVCHYGPCEYTSARLLTKGRFDWAYGRAEARLKIPYGQGLWPAFWMLGANFDQAGWPGSGEIDIMENVGYEPDIVHATVHGPGYSGGNGLGGAYQLPGGEAFKDNFHTFAVEWEPNVLRWYVDNNLYLTLTPANVPAGSQWVFDHPFFLIMNVAVGGYWPGYPDATTVFPQTMLVDYVRVYQAPDTSERFEFSFKDNFSGWKQVSAPFDLFQRSVDQPVGAPVDGLTLKQVWGYGFEFPQLAQPATYYFDNIMLADLHKYWFPLANRRPKP